MVDYGRKKCSYHAYTYLRVRTLKGKFLKYIIRHFSCDLEVKYGDKYLKHAFLMSRNIAILIPFH